MINFEENFSWIESTSTCQVIKNLTVFDKSFKVLQLSCKGNVPRDYFNYVGKFVKVISSGEILEIVNVVVEDKGSPLSKFACRSVSNPSAPVIVISVAQLTLGGSQYRILTRKPKVNAVSQLLSSSSTEAFPVKLASGSLGGGGDASSSSSGAVPVKLASGSLDGGGNASTFNYLEFLSLSFSFSASINVSMPPVSLSINPSIYTSIYTTINIILI